MKKCSKCYNNLPISAFHKNCKKSSGLRSECRECRNKYRREFRKKNPIKFLTYENTEEFKFKSRNSRLKRDYGISIEDFEKMEKNQNKVCAICKNTESHKTKIHLSVDHNHKTSKVRGLLCHRCNVVLGLIKEDFKILKSIVEYLKGDQL